MITCLQFLASSNGIATGTLKSKLPKVLGRLPNVNFGIHSKQDTTQYSLKMLQFRNETLTPNPIVRLDNKLSCFREGWANELSLPSEENHLRVVFLKLYVKDQS